MLSGYSDANFARDIDTRRSTSGFIFRSAGAPISWQSRAQATIVRSSAEAEYIASAGAIKERVRSIVNTLPYNLTFKLLALLVLFCVSRINRSQVVALSTSRTPWERYHGKKIDYKRNLRASFGEYCQAYTNQADNSLDTRSIGGITVYDTGNTK